MSSSIANDLPRHSDQEVRQILRQRKKRNQASCYPCRTRKVKCDRCSPCDNCAKRGYPELCSFIAQRSIDVGTNSASLKPQHSEHLDQLEHHQPQQLSPQAQTRIPSVHTFPSPFGLGDSQTGASQPRAGSNRPASTGGNQDTDSSVLGQNRQCGHKDQDQREPFLGTNSIPAFLRNEYSLAGSAQNTPSQAVEDAILPILGLQESRSAYPFLPTSSTSMERANLELHQALPVDREIIRLFQRYLTEAHPFSPIIPDIAGFELDLCAYLEDRTLRKGRSHLQKHGIPGGETWKSVSWVGSLFAVLASGAQYDHISFQVRQAKSQLYIRHSFQCLRIANFLVRPSLLCIQTLLILGNVLQNEMKPEAAWMLLGTTARMAQSLGLHDEHDDISLPRRRLWLALVWQDSLLSLCFDRPPVTTLAPLPMQLVDAISYTNVMHSLCDRVLRIISVRAHRNTPDFALILEAVAGIEDIHLRSQTTNAGPSSIRERCEMCAVNLHISFAIAWLCRPALRNRHGPESRTGIQLQLIEKCNTNLLESVRAFVQLHSLSILASRSWAVIHNGLSSALLLGLIGATTSNPEVRQLQGEILDIVSADSESEGGRGNDTGGNIELSRPHARAVAALRRLYNDGVTDSARIFVVETERPNQEVLDNQLQPTWQAEIALQGNICCDSYISNDSNTAKLQPPESLSQEMSPLDMFDSIIWDPMETEEFVPDYNASSYASWMF